MSGWAVWLTGLPGCGKSSVAKVLAKLLRKRGIHVQILCLDTFRRIITPQPTYSDEERKVVYGALIYVARLLTENKVNVLIDATANLKRYRKEARRQIPLFMEAYLKCQLDICMAREAKRTSLQGAPKNIYKRGVADKSKTVPGLGVPYEEPTYPAVTVETDRLTPQQSAEKILTAIKERFKLDLAA